MIEIKKHSIAIYVIAVIIVLAILFTFINSVGQYFSYIKTGGLAGVVTSYGYGAGSPKCGVNAKQYNDTDKSYVSTSALGFCAIGKLNVTGQENWFKKKVTFPAIGNTFGWTCSLGQNYVNCEASRAECYDYKDKMTCPDDNFTYTETSTMCMEVIKTEEMKLDSVVIKNINRFKKMAVTDSKEKMLQIAIYSDGTVDTFEEYTGEIGGGFSDKMKKKVTDAYSKRIDTEGKTLVKIVNIHDHPQKSIKKYVKSTCKDSDGDISYIPDFPPSGTDISNDAKIRRNIGALINGVEIIDLVVEYDGDVYIYDTKDVSESDIESVSIISDMSSADCEFSRETFLCFLKEGNKDQFTDEEYNQLVSSRLNIVNKSIKYGREMRKLEDKRFKAKNSKEAEQSIKDYLGYLKKMGVNVRKLKI